MELREWKCICNKCDVKSNHRRIIAHGKKTEFVLINNDSKDVDKRIVDDCLLNTYSRNKKCDYLFNIPVDKVVYFIECKGSDILKAVDQIESTLSILRDSFSGYVLRGRIVPTRVYPPDIKTASYKRLREKLKGDLKVKSIKFIESI